MTDDQMSELIAQLPKIAKRIGRMVDHKLPEFEDLQSEIICDTLAFINSGKFRGDAAIGTIMFTIMRRRIFDYYRRNYRTVNGNEYLILTEPQPLSDHVLLDMKRKVEFAKQFIHKLQPQKRKILRMIYFENKSIREVADEMGLAERTVNNYFLVGLRQLREIVLEHWNDKPNEGAHDDEFKNRIGNRD